MKREITLAENAEIPIRWLRLEEIEPNRLSYYLNATQWIDWLDKRDEALERLARSLPQTVQPQADVSTPTSPLVSTVAAPAPVHVLTYTVATAPAGQCVG